MSKAKLGMYYEYLGLYIHFGDRGSYESEWSYHERKYTVVREMRQMNDKCGIQVHGRERDESDER